MHMYNLEKVVYPDTDGLLRMQQQVGMATATC